MIQNLFVTDAHCHIFPEKIAARAVEGTDRFYGIRLSHGDGTVAYGNYTGKTVATYLEEPVVNTSAKTI